MKTILVTGGIASGKSEVCRYLSSKGFAVYDSDSRTKSLYDSVPGLKKKVEEAIGVPFSQIAVIFKDAAKREALERVVYPEVLKDFTLWREKIAGQAVFFESAIALEKPIFDALWDEVWLVRAPLSGRMSRNPATAERLASQKEIDPERADVIIDNDSSLEDLHKKLDNLINEMKTDLSKIMSVAGKHGLYKFIALY